MYEMLRKLFVRKPDPEPMLSLRGETLSYTTPAGDGWSTNIGKIRAIGEETNQNGPFADDFFLWFVRDHDLLRASVYAVGNDEVLAALSSRLGMAQLRLMGSTTFNSYVLWPAELVGEPLWEYTFSGGRRVGSKLARSVLALTCMTG